MVITRQQKEGKTGICRNDVSWATAWEHRYLSWGYLIFAYLAVGFTITECSVNSEHCIKSYELMEFLRSEA